MTKPLSLHPAHAALGLAALLGALLAPATQARADESKACEPQCRVGYTCVEGECRSLCNPPCGPGLYCTEQRMCALVPATPAVPAPPPTSYPAYPAPPAPPPPARPYPPAPTYTGPVEDPPSVARREAAAQRLQERVEARQRARVARELRLAARETPRLTVALGTGYSQLVERRDLNDYRRTVLGVGGTIGIGLRKNFTRLLGAHADVSATFGQAVISDRTEEVRDRTFAFGLGVGGGAFFSTPWRLYFGPVVSLDWRMYGKDTLTMFGRPYQLNPDGPIHGTVGGEVGILLLGQEQLDVSVRVAAGFPEQLPNAFLTARYHFMPRSL